MWGAACDMDAIMDIARRRDLIVIEDACQGVGGGYKGRMFGAIGDVGCFSFNYYKNMTSGEGGGVAVNDDRLAKRVKGAIDPCHFYWEGRDDEKPFASNGARASELMGAMLNVQLDRLPGMIGAMQAEKKKILAATRGLDNVGLKPAPMNSPDHDCATQVMYTMPTAAAAKRFAEICPSVIAGKTGRHTYTEWDQVLIGAGAAHPLMNPYLMPANQGLRTSYARDQCARSLDILDRTVMVATNPEHGEAETDAIIHNIGVAARVALGGASLDEAELREVAPVDAQKFDIAGREGAA
jgi:dTDP-4-amino-4,6-dideoxygalactose transaminase